MYKIRMRAGSDKTIESEIVVRITSTMATFKQTNLRLQALASAVQQALKPIAKSVKVIQVK